MIVFNDDVDDSQVSNLAFNIAAGHSSSPQHVYQHALKGFSVSLNEAAALAISRNPLVKYVEEDAMVEGAAVQANPSWGLDRIDQRDLPVDSSYYYANSGQGVNVYVIDSGIRFSHQEFSGRAALGVDLVGDGQNGNDCYGHGTHVAAIIAGNTFGVAKAARLHSVRVLDCFNRGSLSRVIAGLDWVTANHAKPAVANLSFISTTASDTLDTAVRSSISAGVTCVVSAGNNNIDAGTRSPSRVTEAITVAATDPADNRAVFSNYGGVVDLFAPGVDILSAWATDDAATSLRSGTSSAAPFVAGMAARYLSANPQETPAAVSQALTSNATAGRVINEGLGSPNLLLGPPKSNIAFQSMRDGNYEIYSMNAEGLNQKRLTINKAYDYEQVYSPDGRKIAFRSNRDGNYEVYVMNADGSNQTRLTTHPAADSDPSWSPDGSKITFLSQRDGNEEIYVMDANGANQTRLTFNAIFEYDPVWSPDGSKIAFRSGRDGNQEIYVMNVDGSNQTRLTYTKGDDYNPVWSPDSSKIAFESYSILADGMELFEVWVVNADGTGLVCLSPYGQSGDYHPAWSPDGKRLAIASTRAGGTQYGTTDIYVINPDGTNPVRLTAFAGNESGPSWSTAGDKIVFMATRDGNYEIYSMNADGSGKKRLTVTTADDYYPRWQQL